jgi:hypothetical protein
LVGKADMKIDIQKKIADEVPAVENSLRTSNIPTKRFELEPYIWTPPTMSAADAVKAVWKDDMPVVLTHEAFVEDCDRWFPDDSFYGKICGKKGYFGIHMRTANSLTTDNLGKFQACLMLNLPTLGLRADRIESLTGSIGDFVKRRCEAAQEFDLQKHVVRLSCTIGDVGAEGRWHSDFMNRREPSSLRTITTLFAVPILDPSRGRTQSGGTLIYPPELVDTQRRDTIIDILSSRGSTGNAPWSQLFEQVDDLVAKWGAKDFDRRTVPHTAIGQPVVFKGGYGGLIHRAPSANEFIYRIILSINSKKISQSDES